MFVKSVSSLAMHKITQAASLALKNLSSSQQLIRQRVHAGDFPPSRIRNFAIIAHVDHGKSTLSDRLLQKCDVIPAGSREQYLDSLEVERTRGITIKAQSCSLVFKDPRDKSDYLLNLIDTPGHVDFHYEVSRSLAACDGVLLLVDAVQGIQAQTVSNYYLAKGLSLSLIGCLNKVDVPYAAIDESAMSLEKLTSLPAAGFARVAGKTGVGVDHLLERIVDDIPCPTGNAKGLLRLLLFDLWYVEGRGVVLLVKVADGELTRGDQLVCKESNETVSALEIGVLHPSFVPTESLKTGQVGYICGNIRSISKWRVGETLARVKDVSRVTAFPGLSPAVPMVFAGVYPELPEDFSKLEVAMQRLMLTDASVVSHRETSPALGFGYRCGFLGLLHLDVFRQRLLAEYGVHAMITSPSVPFKIIDNRDNERVISTAADWPEVPPKEVFEPQVLATIITPSSHAPAIQRLCLDQRGEIVAYDQVDDTRTILKFNMPLMEILVNFFQDLQALSHGYASLVYEPSGYRPAQISKVVVKLNGECIEPLSFLARRDSARESGMEMAARLKEVIKPHGFDIPIQICIGGKVILREKIKANGSSGIQGDHSLAGDPSRKLKIMQRQKEEQKRLREISNVKLPPEAFLQVLKLQSK